MLLDDDGLRMSVIKAGILWLSTSMSFILGWTGLTSWSEVAAFCATVYSLILIADWWRKRRAERRRQARRKRQGDDWIP